MILNNFPGVQNIQLTLIYDSFNNVERDLGSLISTTLNEKWEMQSVKFDFNYIEDYFDSKVNFQESIKCILWQPESISGNLTVFLTTINDGWYTLVNKFFSLYETKYLRIQLSDNNNLFPKYFFEYTDSNNKRVIQVLKDDPKWQFFSKGNVIKFEDELYYQKRKIRERLNNDIIHEYLLKNNINITEDNFWKSKQNAAEFITKFD